MKRAASLLIVFFVFVSINYAHAEPVGMYLAPKFLMSIQDSGTFSRSGSLAGTGIDNYSQFTLGGGLALGYDLWPQQMLPVRLEVEFALRGNSEKTWDDGGAFCNQVKGTWNNSTLFANVFWDFHNDSQFTPYIGGGLGMAFNYTGYDFIARNGEHFSIDDRYTNFTWNVGAGVSFSLNEMLAVDASYRFTGLGYNEISGWHNGQKYEIGNDPYNNEFMLGLRFSF